MQLPQIPRSAAEWKEAASTNSANGGKSSQWINEDLAPTPPDERTWTWYGLLINSLDTLPSTDLLAGSRLLVTGGV